MARSRDLPRAPGEPDQVSPADGGRQPDRQLPDRRLSADDERRMRVLDALPPGHPSSPYLADGSRRPPRPSLRDLEPPGEKPGHDRPAPPETRHHYWAQVTRFLRMWTDHLGKWPKDKQPTASVDRSQDPPGSWRSDSNLLLNPENHARTKDAISELRRTEPRVTGDLQNVVRESPFGPELVGLEFRNKGEDRLKEKVAESLQRRPDAAPEESVLSINDGIRYTICFGEDNYVSGYQDTSQRLEASGYVMFYGRNSWSDSEYKGINTRWATSEGQRFEVQFHTPESYHAKQEVTHEAYERIRNPLTSDYERSELKTFQQEVSSWIPAPEGAQDIPDRRKEHF